MTKSVKELIYDYLEDGKEAYVANKMHYLNQVQGMFRRVTRDQNGALLRNKNGPSGINPLHQVRPLPLGNGGRLGRHMYSPPDVVKSTLGDSGINIGLMELLHKVHRPLLGTELVLKPEFLYSAKIKDTVPSINIGRKIRVELPDVVMSPDAIRRRLDDEQMAVLREALMQHLRQEVKNTLEATGYKQANLLSTTAICCDDTAKTKMAEWGAELMYANMRGMHSHMPSIAAEYDGDIMSEKLYNKMNSKEQPMNYSIKLLTTELFHNEVILLQNLASVFDDSTYGYFRLSKPSDKFAALLKSMADLGLPTLTVEDHEFLQDLSSTAYFDLKKIKMTVTAPTEENPSVILTFVVSPERELVDVPAFAVEVSPVKKVEGDEALLNADIHNLVGQYHTMLSLIAAGIEYNHIPLRNSIVDRFLERRTYVPSTRDRTIRNGGHALDLPTIMLTVGKSVEKLLANNVLRAEYLDRMKSLGIELAEMGPYDTTARYDALESGMWMVHPVILDNLEQRFTVAVSEDQIMDTAIPRIYEKALGTLEREKALRFAGEFFGTERLENKAE